MANIFNFGRQPRSLDFNVGRPDRAIDGSGKFAPAGSTEDALIRQTSAAYGTAKTPARTSAPAGSALTRVLAVLRAAKLKS